MSSYKVIISYTENGKPKDAQYQVEAKDVGPAEEQALRLHASKVPYARNVKVAGVAELPPGTPRPEAAKKSLDAAYDQGKKTLQNPEAPAQLGALSGDLKKSKFSWQKPKK